MITLKLKYLIYFIHLLNKMHLLKRKHYDIAEICYLNKKTFIFMYTIFIFVKINTKQRINLQTKINKHSFLAIISCLCHSSHMLTSAG